MHGQNGYSNNNPENAIWRINQLHRKIEMHRDEIVLTQAYDTDDMDVLLIAYGATTGASRNTESSLRGNDGNIKPEKREPQSSQRAQR